MPIICYPDCHYDAARVLIIGTGLDIKKLTTQFCVLQTLSFDHRYHVRSEFSMHTFAVELGCGRHILHGEGGCTGEGSLQPQAYHQPASKSCTLSLRASCTFKQ